MKQPCRLAKLIALSASLAFSATTTVAQTSVPAELKNYYEQNSAGIAASISIAEDRKQSTKARLDAFDALRIAYPRAALDTAIKLSKDDVAEIAIEATTFLTSILVMMNHGPTLDSHDHGSNDQSVAKTVAALRKTLNDPRQNVREVAAASLASLNDEPTLKALENAFKAHKVSDVEALRYITLAKPTVAAEYVAPFLNSGSIKAKSEAVSYLSSVEQYRNVVKGYLVNTNTPIEIRAAAAKGLARHDPKFGSYAPALVMNPKLPSAVFNSLVSEMSNQLPPRDVQNVLNKAVQSPLDQNKFEAVSKSINRYEAVRPDIDLGSVAGSLKRLNPT